jgi:dolichol-phosphate mannosyltransferase
LATAELDIVMPVFNEGDRVLPAVHSLVEHVRTTFRLLVCHDHDDDPTLPVLRAMADAPTMEFVRNRRQGALGAIVTGFEHSTAPVVLTMPADDDYNAPRLDAMVDLVRGGVDIVCPSRFIGGSRMVGAPILKSALIRLTAAFMYHVVGVPTHDATHGMRLFSRRVIDQIPIESTAGFAYSIELLVKAQRLGWRIVESPADWFERRKGRSRFRVFEWAPSYLRWVEYALATRFLGRGSETVRLNNARPA